jgi:spermidine synthase
VGSAASIEPMNSGAKDRCMAHGLALAIVVASGFAGLGYQIVWTQQSALWLGHEAAAVLAVLAAFFGGIALGSFALGERIERSSHPARWYAGCEAVIGIWSMVLAFLLPRIAPALLTLIGPQPSDLRHGLVAFVGTSLLLAPATIAMGGTLPAIERLLSHVELRSVRIAMVYAGNTFGAVLGVLMTAFWLIPMLGLQRSATLCAVLNFGCAALAHACARSIRASDPAAALAHPCARSIRASCPAAVVALKTWNNRTPAIPAATARPRKLLWLLAATGLLGIGYEVLVIRVLSQVAENTVYTFAIALAVYLLGTSCGAALYARWRSSDRSDTIGRDRLLQLLAFSCLISVLSLSVAEQIRDALLAILGPGMHVALLCEAAIAFAAFFLPTLVMGALFSDLSAQARAMQVSFGRALGWNTMGAAIASPLFGTLLVPKVGPTYGLVLISASYLALVAPRIWTQQVQWVLASAVAACVVWSPTLAFVHVPSGGRVVSRVEGSLATVSIIEDGDRVARLHINNRQQEGSSATLLADARQALLPLLLHPEPQQALFLGLGTGVTALSATMDPELRVDVVELLPEVIVASSYFTAPLDQRLDPSRVNIMHADARRFARTTSAHYDVIVADNFHPARSGSGSLYTVEHFRAIRARLSDDGIFCQWLPLHQLDLETLRTIAKTFLNVFPNASALLATNSLETPVLGLIARADDAAFVLNDVHSRLTRTTLFDAASQHGLKDEYAVLGSFIAGARALEAFAGQAPLNTDDHPVVIYRAPRMTYEPTSLPRDRLIDLLHRVNIEPRELIAPTHEEQFDARLSAYWSARNRFIEAGRDVRPSSNVQQMLTQVRAPLLEVLRTSPDFRPAYDPLLQMAQVLMTIDSDAAQELLDELQRIQPERSEASQILLGSQRARRSVASQGLIQ